MDAEAVIEAIREIGHGGDEGDLDDLLVVEVLEEAIAMAALRRQAAVEIHRVCADFARDVNKLLAKPQLLLDPPEYSKESFTEEGTNLIQLNIRGRILQVAFEASVDLVSTENFRVPYTLEGAVRAFNQELLDKDLIEEQLIFYTLEKQKNMWRFFDPRTYRSGPFDEEYLICLMEQLL